MQVSWSPNHDDKFFTFGTDLCLYRVNDLRDDKEFSPKEEGMKISERSFASLMSIATDVQYKCVAWRPSNSGDHLLAVGLSTGRVQMSCFGKGGPSDTPGLVGKEFVLRHPRACNFLEWSPMETHLLAEGVERYRQDPCILIWDVSAQTTYDFWVNSDRKPSSMSADNVCITKPLYEIGPSEFSQSLAWFGSTPRTIVTGMSNKSLRIYDLRDPSRPQSNVATKSVCSVTIDRRFENRIASCYENQISVWDTRNFDKPILTHQQSKNILKVAWCPERAGLLACINKDSSALQLYDFRQFTSGGDEVEPPYVERFILPFGSNHISSFDWHPTQADRLLTVSPSGAVADVSIYERVAICWSPDIYLTWSSGSQVRQYHSIKHCKEASDDISVKMRRRALRGYGIAKTMEENIKCVAGEEKLRKLWTWISMMKDIRTEGSSSSRFQGVNPFAGIKAILKPCSALRSEQEFWCWQGLDSQNRTSRKIYCSEERMMALEMCGWSTDKNSASLPIIDRLETEHQFEQAAAVAVFNLKLTRAINALRKGAQIREKRSTPPADGTTASSLYAFVMALSGFADDKNALWKDCCGSLISTISHPYLRAIFYFLTTDSDEYEGLLNDPKLELSDQVAFACMYLPDAKLVEYVDKLTSRLISEGNPYGVMLTGLSSEGIELFSSYVDRTSDIQTAVVAIIQSFSGSDLAKNSQVLHWIETYRELLNRMRLWKERAEFDVFLSKLEKTREQEVQVYICCNFCGKSISFESLANRNRVMNCNTGSGPPIKPRIASCPSCRKPLPRCALCLMHMGTPAGMSKLRHGSNQLPEKKLSKISEWFTWCQSCHHGGHADHLTTWFKDHKECPVSGCDCRCTALDPAGEPVRSLDSTASVAALPDTEAG